MFEQNIEDLSVGPYIVNTRQAIKTEVGPREGQPRLERYHCKKGDKVFTAKCIQRDAIGTAAKRKGHQKWQAQLKTVTDICSSVNQSPSNQHHIIPTLEIIRTSQSYWMIQDYDPEKVITLADFLHRQSQKDSSDSSQSVPFLKVLQLHSMAHSVAQLFVELSSKKRFVHGNLDSRSIFIESSSIQSNQQKGPNDDENMHHLQIRIDTSEHHLLTKLLKPISNNGEVETQEETTSEEQAKTTCAFEEFRRRQQKFTEQTDVQALGQLILLLMKHTDFSDVDKSVSDKISDLVQSCSFTFKTWQQVLAHSVFQDSESFLQELQQQQQQPAHSVSLVEQPLQQVVEEVDVQDQVEFNEPALMVKNESDEAEAARLDMVPLQESTVLFEAAQQDDDAGQEGNLIDDGLLLGSEVAQMEESKIEVSESVTSSTSAAAATSQHNMTSATLCEDLEQLLETGFAELIRTGLEDTQANEATGGEVEMAVVLDDSPFPKGMKVFDGDADDDENSPFEDEVFDNGYEVICAREIVQIPVYATPAGMTPGSSESANSMLGQGASYMMGKASKLLGSFFTSTSPGRTSPAATSTTNPTTK